MTDESIPYGYCQCGCGELAPMPTRNSTHWGYRKGEPLRFRRGHSGRKRPEDWGDHLWEETDTGYASLCWLWRGARDHLGYGRVTRGHATTALAHKINYESAHGATPLGMELDHLCRQPSCVRPDHLECVTHGENLRRGAGAKLNPEKARAIHELRSAGMTHRSIAELFDVSTRTISDTLAGKRWRHDCSPRSGA